MLLTHVLKKANCIFRCKHCGCDFNTGTARALHEAGKLHKRAIEGLKDRSDTLCGLACDRNLDSTRELQTIIEA